MNTSRPGWKTTEFWLTTLFHVATMASAVSGVLPPQYAAIASAAAQLGYSVARGLSKYGADEFPNDRPEEARARHFVVPGAASRVAATAQSADLAPDAHPPTATP